MAESFSASHIERFKRQAKVLGRSLGIAHGHALDKIATDNGYDNWSLLAKHSTVVDEKLPAFRFARTIEAMRLATHKVQPPSRSRMTRVDAAREAVEDISRRFVSAQNVADFAVDYMRCLLALSRFKVYAATTVNWEMRCWLPYLAQAIEGEATVLVNRRYKPVGQVSEDWAQYQDFPHLHLHLDVEGLKTFAFDASHPGVLFNDGCLPWASRKNAEAYLRRLLGLQATLRR